MDDYLQPDEELLAALLWDHFGPKLPANSAAQVAAKKAATQDQVEAYRQCAKDIISSWRVCHAVGDYGSGQ